MPDNSQLTTETWPTVTALCPTYGRFQRLRDAVACFLLQDYPGVKALYIGDDSPGPASVWCKPPGVPCGLVASIQWAGRWPTLGHKRQALLEAAIRPVVAHWDDDDLYLPWHLTQCVEAMQREGALCAKPGAAWWATGCDDVFLVRGPCHNVFEGQMVFDRERAIEHGGYPGKVSGQAKALLDKFARAGELHRWNPPDAKISYVYRWSDGLQHISGGGDNQASHERFAERNQDFGDGQCLIDSDDPIAWAQDRLRSQFQRLADGIRLRTTSYQADVNKVTDAERR